MNKIFLKHTPHFLSIIITLVIIFISDKSFSQNLYEKNFYGGMFYISNYIISSNNNFANKQKNDLDKVDSIYINALKFFNYDVSETLFCLTFACLPYNKIRLKFLFSTIEIPLPSPSLRIFNERLENLPKNIFFDSPQDDFGDKDKLSHFFGNAFLNYNSSFFNLSKFLGIFVEIVERDLFVDGNFDRRDLIVNNLGELFGKTLKQNSKILPSDALKIYQLLFLRLY